MITIIAIVIMILTMAIVPILRTTPSELIILYYIDIVSSQHRNRWRDRTNRRVSCGSGAKDISDHQRYCVRCRRLWERSDVTAQHYVIVYYTTLETLSTLLYSNHINLLFTLRSTSLLFLFSPPLPYPTLPSPSLPFPSLPYPTLAALLLLPPKALRHRTLLCSEEAWTNSQPIQLYARSRRIQDLSYHHIAAPLGVSMLAGICFTLFAELLFFLTFKKMLSGIRKKFLVLLRIYARKLR